MKSYILISYLLITMALIYADNLASLAVDNITSSILSNINMTTEPSLELSPLLDPSIENNNAKFIHLPFLQLVKDNGYQVEEHQVKTSDGYLLTMFRIPNKGPVVLLIHGLLSSSSDFVTTGPQAGLAYQLANAGYDVWLMNCRGNNFSLDHVTLQTNSEAFWDFSFDEMGRYDLPASIDYVLNATNAKDLTTIGHSQGTNALLVLCSERPEYNDKISLMILLSVTAFMGHTNSPGLRLISGPLTPDFYTLAKSIDLHSLFTKWDIGPVITQLKNIFCATPETADIYCNTVLILMFGQDRSQVNVTNLPVMYGHFPASVSIKSLQHYALIVQKGKFTQYDYGKEDNLVKYQSEDPPEYPLEKITTKVAIAWADNDWLCTEKDLHIVLNKLPNVVDVYKVPHKEFTHADYIFAKDVKALLYDKLLEWIKAIK